MVDVFLKNLLWSPDHKDADRLKQRPAKTSEPEKLVIEDGDSLAFAGAAASVGSLKGGDYWFEMKDRWILTHRTPRYRLYNPVNGNVKGGPKVEDLAGKRSTVCHKGEQFVGDTVVYRDDWRKESDANRNLGFKWVGRTIFFKKGSDSDLVVPVVDGSSSSSSPAVSSVNVPVVQEATDVAASIPLQDTSSRDVGFALTCMRAELKEAQGKDPELAAIVAALKKKPLGAFLVHPRRDGQAVRAKAERSKLDSDGLLVWEVDGVWLPVVPEVPYEGKSKLKDAPKTMTWKHLLLASVHYTSTGLHRVAKDMVSELQSIVAWKPPSKLRQDCETFANRCKSCTAVHKRPPHHPVPKPILEHRPFHRIQIDLLEIRPSSELGHTHVLTVVCCATRYTFLRPLQGREAAEVAEALMDVLLDAGVIPKVVQGDQEFVNVVLEELCCFLGSAQLFSTSLRPQSQGIVERTHREIRESLSILVESLSRAMPRRWVKYLRWVEHKLRHKRLACGYSPYQLVHGFAGSSALRSALEVFQEIPEELLSDWLSSVVAESKFLVATAAEHFKEQAAVTKEKAVEANRQFVFRQGDLVLLQKPFYEKGTGYILPQCDGPYVVDRVFDDHAVRLSDIVTGEMVMNGKRVATSRLVRFHYPVDCLEDDMIAEVEHHLHVGIMVMIPYKNRLHVARVDQLFETGQQAEVTVFEVPQGERYGPWNRRPWLPVDANKLTIPLNEVIVIAELDNKALTSKTLDLLVSKGYRLVEPTKEKGLLAIT